MPLFPDLALISMRQKCWLSIYCMNLNLVYGSRSSYSLSAWFMPLGKAQRHLWLNWIQGLYMTILLGDDQLSIVHRYRQISTFGTGTIRKFSQNSSEMKKLAARDFEDLLQV